MSVLLGQPYTQKAIIKNQQKIITVVESMQHFSFAQSWHIPSQLGLTSLETKHIPESKRVSKQNMAKV